MSYKKYLILAGIALIFIFPDQIFPALVGIIIILFILLFVIELVLDIYIVVKILIPHNREKREDKEKTL